jgi:DNA-binding HxlR family transcriptional regulator
MAEGSYRQFCPVAMGSEILGSRWTIVLIRELICGSNRFNDLRRGVPRMSPALLSKRLKDLEEAGIVLRLPSAADPDVHEYHLTESGKELAPVIMAVGNWGARWIRSEASLENLDPDLLMWDMRRSLMTDPMPSKKSTIQFTYPDLPANQRKYWLIVEPGKAVDVCSVDPGNDVDLYVSVDLRTMTEIWMGQKSVAKAVESGAMSVVGNRALEENMQTWLGLSPFAAIERAVP